MPDLAIFLEGFEGTLAGEEIEVAERLCDRLREPPRWEPRELASGDAKGTVGLLFEEPADALRPSRVVGFEAGEQRLWLFDGLAVAGEDAAGGERSDVGDGVDEGRERGPALGGLDAVAVGGDRGGVVHAGGGDGGGEDGVAAEQFAGLGDEGDEVAGGVAGGVDHLEGAAIGEVVADRRGAERGGRAGLPAERRAGARGAHLQDEVFGAAVADEVVELGGSLCLARLLTGGDGRNVCGAGEDCGALGGPAVGETGVIEVGVGDQDVGDVAKLDAVGGELGCEQRPRFGSVDSEVGAGVDEEGGAGGEGERVENVVAEWDVYWGGGGWW